MKDRREFLIGVAIGIVLCLVFVFAVRAETVNAAIPTDVQCAMQENEITELSESEIEMLAHLVRAEAGNQTMLGKQLVVDVVLNRMRSDKFPNTVEGVIYAPRQFACSGYFMSKKPSQEDYDAVYSEIELRQNREVIYFRTEHYGNGVPLFQEDDHYFSGL